MNTSRLTIYKKDNAPTIHCIEGMAYLSYSPATHHNSSRPGSSRIQLLYDSARRHWR